MAPTNERIKFRHKALNVWACESCLPWNTCSAGWSKFVDARRLLTTRRRRRDTSSLAQLQCHRQIASKVKFVSHYAPVQTNVGPTLVEVYNNVTLRAGMYVCMLLEIAMLFFTHLKRIWEWVVNSGKRRHGGMTMQQRWNCRFSGKNQRERMLCTETHSVCC